MYIDSRVEADICFRTVWVRCVFKEWQVNRKTSFDIDNLIHDAHFSFSLSVSLSLVCLLYFTCSLLNSIVDSISQTCSLACTKFMWANTIRCWTPCSIEAWTKEPSKWKKGNRGGSAYDHLCETAAVKKGSHRESMFVSWNERNFIAFSNNKKK